MSQIGWAIVPPPFFTERQHGPGRVPDPPVCNGRDHSLQCNTILAGTSGLFRVRIWPSSEAFPPRQPDRQARSTHRPSASCRPPPSGLAASIERSTSPSLPDGHGPWSHYTPSPVQVGAGLGPGSIALRFGAWWSSLAWSRRLKRSAIFGGSRSWIRWLYISRRRLPMLVLMTRARSASLARILQ